MIAAISAAEAGAEVTLLEKNDRLGVKLRITGKGRCNITNNCDADEVLRNIPVNSKFLISAMKAFPPSHTMSFFESLGVALKTERGNRVFPVSESAPQVAQALSDRLKELKVRVEKNRAVDIITKDGKVYAAGTPRGSICCRCLVIATGGLSYPKTGSTGDGYKLAKSVGHTVTQTFASLVPLESSDIFCGRMQGLSLKNVRLTLEGEKNGRLFDDIGEMQFTHFGVSGPLVLTASSHMRDASDRYRVHIDLKPGLDEKKLDARILRDFTKYSNKEFRNALEDLASRLMIPVLVDRSGIPPETRVNTVTREQRKALTALFKDFSVDITNKRPIDEAVITSGGVSVTEVNPKTMASKLLPGLYFAGEVLDVDAYTGGYNLQIAWATGRLAGMNAAKECLG